uniref:Uncharacterized protein n=1 Tax=Knipowitschia caucasica TaxID=637954 RepID=A0AAV2KSR2_KNICA
MHCDSSGGDFQSALKALANTDMTAARRLGQRQTTEKGRGVKKDPSFNMSSVLLRAGTREQPKASFELNSASSKQAAPRCSLLHGEMREEACVCGDKSH